MLQSAELAEVGYEKKRKRPAPPGPKTHDPDAMLRAHERRSENVAMTPEEYEALKASAPEFYRAADSMLHGVRGLDAPDQATLLLGTERAWGQAAFWEAANEHCMGACLKQRFGPACMQAWLTLVCDQAQAEGMGNMVSESCLAAHAGVLTNLRSAPGRWPRR